ncbi:methyltransferase FkbM family protein [Chondrocystis sp. NIES-4102]|nr:methyltransferase FkbM family protein [Chondrocystis sp. NIES-4102]
MLIEEFSTLKYIKIDVEGFETEVLKALSQSIDLISFEFHYQQISKVMEYIDLLSNVQERCFKITPTDKSYFIFEKWQTKQEIEDYINKEWDISLLGKRGDIYARAI